MSTRRGNPSGFTLTELMVAVVVLVIVVLATGKIFGTASAISGLGMATENVLQESAAIERLLRKDFERLSYEGFFAIQSHAVPNDIHDPVMLNPALPPDALVRCDQLVFFTTGVQGTQTFTIKGGSNRKGQATAARVYYGHTYQLPGARGFDTGQSRAHDLDPDNITMNPWYSSVVDGPVGMAWTKIETSSTNFPAPPSYTSTGSPSIDATQPEARRWILARQPVLLADDDQLNGNEKTLFLGNMAARSIARFTSFGASPQIRDGRVDAAGERLNAIRNAITNGANPNFPWNPGQRNTIASQLVYFPRAERQAPSQHRIDQSLTNHALTAACSSFAVEWTYDEGVGAAPGYSGIRYDSTDELPWFGVDYSYRNWVEANEDTPFGGPDTIGLEPGRIGWIEQTYADPNDGHQVYQAFFGFNGTEPLDLADQDDDGDFRWPINSGFAYTPWPSAVRITMVLHDPETRLENGRRVQFVIRLPRRK